MLSLFIERIPLYVFALERSYFMFIHISWPICDLRAFGDFDRLKKPNWPNPREDRDFIRNIGVVRTRLRGGLTGFASEDFYVQANRIVVETKELADRLGIPPSLIKVLFRRLYITNGPVVHMDLGLSVRHDAFQNIAAITEALLNVPLTIKGTRVKFGVAGKLISEHYLENSTPKDALVPKNVMAASGPTIVYELLSGDEEWVKLIQLHAHKTSSPVWILSPAQNIPVRQSRALRLTLIRLRSEREALKAVLSAADNGTLKFEARTPGGDKLTRYLDRADRLFKGQVPDNLVRFMDKSEYQKVLNVALSADRLFQPGAIDRLHLAFEDIRPNMLRKLKGWSASDEKRMELLQTAQGIPVSHLELDMSENKFSVKDSTGVAIVGRDGNAIVHQNIGSDLKDLLDLLTEQASEAAKQLPPDEAKKVMESVEEVKSVVTSEKPVQKWYEVSAEGLKDAAKAVVGIIPNIGETLVKIQKLVFP